MRYYSETLAEVGKTRFEKAFDDVLKSSTFRPSIGEIRRAAGVDSEAEAHVELRKVLTTQREHQRAFAVRFEKRPEERNAGWKLKVIPGTQTEILRSFENPRGGTIYGPDTPAPTFSSLTEGAILGMGYGDREAGLQTLASHPSLPQEDRDDAAFRVQREKDIERRWVEEYVAAKRRPELRVA